MFEANFSSGGSRKDSRRLVFGFGGGCCNRANDRLNVGAENVESQSYIEELGKEDEVEDSKVVEKDDAWTKKLDVALSATIIRTGWKARAPEGLKPWRSRCTCSPKRQCPLPLSCKRGNCQRAERGCGIP